MKTYKCKTTTISSPAIAGDVIPSIFGGGARLLEDILKQHLQSVHKNNKSMTFSTYDVMK
ncbi:toxin-antitoxin system, antitoxin component, Xre family [Trichinella spiralis]|uniref:toxin-antitoxin system, antitoxin component, Xre family n=1 Tax=Trichinella spiralis TaxID=6334 RepID=UPI0001EFC953|nr:toxin-antitoxin system, antitoxin component, Xre family [Trichinella spiralis]